MLVESYFQHAGDSILSLIHVILECPACPVPTHSHLTGRTRDQFVRLLVARTTEIKLIGFVGWAGVAPLKIFGFVAPTPWTGVLTASSGSAGSQCGATVIGNTIHNTWNSTSAPR